MKRETGIKTPPAGAREEENTTIKEGVKKRASFWAAGGKGKIKERKGKEGGNERAID